jgi:hypothetical protein
MKITIEFYRYNTFSHSKEIKIDDIEKEIINIKNYLNTVFGGKVAMKRAYDDNKLD